MNIWIKEDVERVLLQLNEWGLPFEKYSFAAENGHLKLLGRGGVGYVFEAEKKGKRNKRYAIKVNGFKEKKITSEFFRDSMGHQELLSINNENVMKIYAYTEVLVWMDEEYCVLRAAKVSEKEQADAEALCLQFVLMEKAEPIVAVNRYRKKEIVCPGLQSYKEAEVLRLAADIGHILWEVHKDGVLHKDVKLENIFYSDKKKKYMLGDFGIAEKVEDGTSKIFSGTAGYAAPEVLALKWRHDATADIYSLGMALYLLMNDGYFPEAQTRFQANTKKQYREGYIPSRPKHGSDALWAIVEKMCMYDADDRYQHMEDVLNDIKQLIYEEEIYYKQRHRKSYLLEGGILLFFGFWVSKMGERMQLLPDDIYWIKWTLFSLGGFMLVCGSDLAQKWETPFVRNEYITGKFWRRITSIYVAMAMLGLLCSFGVMEQAIHNVPGVLGMPARVIREIAIEYDFLKVGGFGTAFCVFWTFREQFLFHFKKNAEEEQM